jgi:membrane protein YqaA with SNARE-associated domain
VSTEPTAPPATATATPPSRLQLLFRRLQRAADAGWAGRVVFAWGLLQGCVFPGLADVFFLPLSLARPRRAYGLALIATAGTLLGSVFLFGVGAFARSWLEGPLAAWMGLTPAELTNYQQMLGRYGALAIFASTLSPLSTKLTSIASGMIGVPFPAFTAALLAGRLTRTLALAWLVRHGGATALARWIEPRPSTPR